MIDYQVLLIGGSSGTGKSILARSLSQKWGIPALQVDDFRLLLERVVELALEKTNSSAALWDQLGLHGLYNVKELYASGNALPELRVDALKATANAMSSALEIVLAHHIATRTPIIIEGDGLLPSLITRRPIANLYPEPGQLQGVFLVEEEEARLMFTALQRDRGFSEKSSTEQQQIVRTSWMFGQWLKAEADIHSVPVVNPLPYETLLERVLQTVQVNE